jgi:hypothetical protein
MNYNFKNFFKQNKISNNEYACNAHFIIKRSELTNAQNNYIDTFSQDKRVESMIKIYNDVLAKESSQIIEIVPALLGKLTNTEEEYDIVINSNNIAIREEYYNFFKSLNCRVFYDTFYDIKKSSFNPLTVYNKDNEVVGIVCPVKLEQEDIENAKDYNSYIDDLKEKEEQDKQNKQDKKKCLYISNNKAIIRNKEIICVADIVNDEAYKNLYISSDYKNKDGMVYIDFGFVCMYATSMSKYYNVENIKEHLYALTTITFEGVKESINKCLENMQFINVAEIKLMELAGESLEYIQKLVEHRQKVLDNREAENQKKELERENEEIEYLQEKENKLIQQIEETEQAIINKQLVKNIDITEYKARYNSKTMSIILYLMKKYEIEIPLKTQGWINSALTELVYDKDAGEYGYTYYNSSADSTVFIRYLRKLIQKVNSNKAVA